MTCSLISEPFIVIDDFSPLWYDIPTVNSKGGIVVPKDGQAMSSLEMRNLILEALAEEDKANTPYGMTFKMYGYKGCVSDLRAIVEYLAVKHNIIDKEVEFSATAWGVPGGMRYYKRNTNFDDDELNLFTEEVHQLMFQNVLSPGATRNYGDDWPYFHVTKYGLECLKYKDVLPYDPDGYLRRLSAIVSVDEWEKFYVAQSLRCFNAGALEASIIMLVLAGEYLAGKLIDAMDAFLAKNEQALSTQFSTALSGLTQISRKYAEYDKILKEVLKQTDGSGNCKYPALKSLSPQLDVPAKTVYATFLRLTRNELAHPTDVRMDRIECLTMLISYIKYCETQHQYLDFYTSNT